MILTRLPAALLLLGLLGCTGAAPQAAPAPSAAPTTLLALGDSVAAGVGAPSRDAGYPALLRDRLARECDCEVRLEDLAVSGATTSTVLRDQLPRAREVLARGDVSLVTLTAGGNDVFGPVVGACFSDPAAPACRSTAVQAVAATDRGLDQVLGALAATDVPVAVMTYYDPLPACRLAALSPLARQVLEGDGDQQGLNDVVRARAAEHGAVLVETAERLEVPDDFVGGNDCLHPSGSGHAALAEAFADAVQRARP